jgi:hypothetical protein
MVLDDIRSARPALAFQADVLARIDRAVGHKSPQGER